MGIFDLNFNPFESTDNEDDFFSGLWTDRTENAYKDFFSGGWKDWKNWLNPGGVMANPAQQIADPGNFFTSEEHENWIDGKGMSDRTAMSALVAGAAYGGGSLLSGMGGEAGAGLGGDSAALFDFGGTGSTGSAGGFDWASLFKNQDFTSLLGSSGQNLQQGKPMNDQLNNPMGSSYRADQQKQKQLEDLLKLLKEKNLLDEYDFFNLMGESYGNL